MKRAATASPAPFRRLDPGRRGPYLTVVMAIRRILTVDNAADLAILKQVSKDVPAVTDELRALMDDMLETMYDAPGIGLAAVQVGELVNVIVMDLAREGEEPAPRYFVNPKITWESEELFSYEEGCLSVPEVYDAVERPAQREDRLPELPG